jgi:hypothetical protein
MSEPLTKIAPTTRATFSAAVHETDFQAQDPLAPHFAPASRGRTGSLILRCCAEDHGATFRHRELSVASDAWSTLAC